MKVILISAIHNLGNIGDVVEVKNGYAKNFLIPEKKALCYSANNLKAFEAKRHDFELGSQEKLASAKKAKELLFGKNIIIIENASDDGRLYGSVNSINIATKLNEALGEKLVLRSHISLKKPIKEIGIYEVVLNLHPELTFSSKVVVTRSESEVEALLKTEKKSQKSDQSLKDKSSEQSEVKSEK